MPDPWQKHFHKSLAEAGLAGLKTASSEDFMHISGKKLLAPLAGALLCSALSASPAQSIDYKISGAWVVGFEHSNVVPRGYKGSDSFDAIQRFRTQLQARASESLSGTIEFEIGRTEWGKAANGGALGADGKIVQVRFAYIDWMVPQTDAKVRMGLQTLMLPGVLSKYGFGPIFGKEMAGVSVSSPLFKGESVQSDLTFFWARPYNDNSAQEYTNLADSKTRWLDNLDCFALMLPFRGDGWKLEPYAMYSLIGKYSMTGVTAAMGDTGIVAPRGGLTPVLGGGVPTGGNRGYTWLQGNELHKLDRDWGNGFWAGLVGQFDLTGTLRLGVEGAFGSVYLGEIKNYGGFGDKGRTLQMKRQGWYAGARLDYKADWGVPGIIAWYGSGDDDNPYNGSERLPQFNTPWAVSSLGFGDPCFDEQTWKVLGHNPGGTAGVIAQIDKISFVPDLTHLVRVGFYLGTNSSDMPGRIGMNWPNRADGPMAYLTTKDNAWEVNLVNTYKIYENLTFQLEGAYVRLNLDKDTWGEGRHSNVYRDNYRVSCMFKYSF